MGKRLLLVALLVVGIAGTSFAVQTGTSNQVNNSGSGWVHQGRSNTVLLLETTTSALGQALTNLGVAYDDAQGPPFPSPTGYTDVFLAMDGGLVEPTDIQPLAAWAQAGGHLHFYGGTCWQDYVVGMNTYLVTNDINNYCWTTVGGQPQVVVVDANNCLAKNLPATYNWSNNSASYYEFRATDTGIAIAANNGDGIPMLFSKPIGGGTFDYCIDSAYSSYYVGGDMTILQDIVQNMLFNCQAPVPVQQSTWGQIKSMYH